MSGFVLVHAECFGVKTVLLDIVLDLVVGFYVFEMVERLSATAQLIINLEFSTQNRKFVESLKMGKVLARVLQESG
jgi:PleD family two-component response regulator